MKVGRNDPCPCGSGKKYKKCCLLSFSINTDTSVESDTAQALTLKSLLTYAEDVFFSGFVSANDKKNNISWLKKNLHKLNLLYSNTQKGFFIELTFENKKGFIGVDEKGKMLFRQECSIEFEKVLTLLFYILRENKAVLNFSKNPILNFHVRCVREYFLKKNEIKLEAIAISNINIQIDNKRPDVLLNEIVSLKRSDELFFNINEGLSFFSQISEDDSKYLFHLEKQIEGNKQYFRRNESSVSPFEDVKYIFSDGEVIPLYLLVFHPYVNLLTNDYLPLSSRSRTNKNIMGMTWFEEVADYRFYFGDTINKEHRILLDLFYRISKSPTCHDVRILLTRNPGKNYREHIFNEVKSVKFIGPKDLSIEVCPNDNLSQSSFNLLITSKNKEIRFQDAPCISSNNDLVFHQVKEYLKDINQFLFPTSQTINEGELTITSKLCDATFGERILHLHSRLFHDYEQEISFPEKTQIPENEIKLILHLKSEDEKVKVQKLTWGAPQFLGDFDDRSFNHYPEILNFLFECLEWGISALFHQDGKDLAIQKKGYERQHDLKLLRHSGIFLFIFMELLRHFEKYQNEKKSGKKKIIDDVYQKSSAIFHHVATKEEINQEQKYDFQDHCSLKVSRLMRKAFTEIMERLKGERKSLFSQGHIYDFNTGVFIRNFSKTFCEHLADPKNKKHFLKTKLKQYNHRVLSCEEDAILQVSFPRLDEWAFQLDPEHADVYLSGEKLDVLTKNDFQFQYHLSEDDDKIDWFELHPKVFFKGEEISQDALKVFSSNKVVPFKGKYYLLDRNEIPGFKWLDYFWENLSSGNLGTNDRKKRGTSIEELPKSQVLNVLALRKLGANILGGEKWSKVYHEFDKLISRSGSDKKDKNSYPALPKKLNVPLKDYQKIGVQWLMDLYNIQLGGILADDMGLGKTIQTLCFLDILRIKKDLKKTMIVVPTSLVYNWIEEAKKFTPKLLIERFNSQKVNLFEDKWGEGNQEHKVLLVTYGQLLGRKELLTKNDWNLCIFDESQNIKNITSKRTTAARLLKAKCKFCLTGTPMENHFGEYFSMIDLVVPGALGKYQEFMAKYSFRSSTAKSSEKVVSAEDIEFLKLKTAPLVLRRMKSQILDELPGKTETVLHLEFDKEQKAIYKNIALSWNEKIQTVIEEKGSAHGQLEKLTALLRLRQACSTPSVLPNVKYLNHSPKMIQLLSMVVELYEKGESVLVFTNFVSSLEVFKSYLEDHKVSCLAITGKVNANKREKILNSFNQDESASVLFMTLKTGGVGLNLTRASYVFHIEPWWNPASENQATDRAYRIGQTKKVQVYRFIMANSVEEKIQTLKSHKSAAFESLFFENEGDDFSKTKAKSLTFDKKGLDQKDFEYLLS